MDKNKFGTFRSTYKYTSFILCISMMYPHPETIKRRFVGLSIICISLLLLLISILIDIYDNLINGEILNVIHHTTIAGPYLGGVVKVLSTLYMAKEGNEIIKEIDKDYRLYNTLPEDYQNMVKTCIKSSLKYGEKYWSFIVVTSVLCYPMASTFLNIKSQLYDENPRRYMVHDMPVLFVDSESRFESPQFEVMYAYMIYAGLTIMIYYLGYDSFFIIAMNHACLRIDMYCKAFEDAMKCKIKKERCMKLGSVVQEQLRLLEFVGKLQKYFNIYLGLSLFATFIQIGTCLYHITESPTIEIQYIMIAGGSISVIFLPCSYATKLNITSQESATKFYSAGWENVHCVSTRKIILFMIARAQIPLHIKAFSWIIFDMTLFVSILRSAYSIYTVLCS